MAMYRGVPPKMYENRVALEVAQPDPGCDDPGPDQLDVLDRRRRHLPHLGCRQHLGREGPHHLVVRGLRRHGPVRIDAAAHRCLHLVVSVREA
jgi:hypothetical protein